MRKYNWVSVFFFDDVGMFAMEIILWKMHRVQAAEASRKGSLRGRLRKEDLILYVWRAFRSINLENMRIPISHYPSHHLLVLLWCFAEAARKLRGSTAEGKHTQTTVLPAAALRKCPSPRQTKRKRPKWNEMKAQKEKTKGNEGPKGQNESKWRPKRPKWKEMNQPQPESLGNVVALWSRKQKLRKPSRGSSRKGYMWNVRCGSWRCGRGSIAEAVAEAVNNFLSTRKGKKTKLNWFCWGCYRGCSHYLCMYMFKCLYIYIE